MPAFAKPGLIHRNPPVQVGEGTCQVQRRQPVLIRYQIREVSGSRRTGATLLFLADPKPLPTSSSPKTQPSPPNAILFPSRRVPITPPLHLPPPPQLPLTPQASAPSAVRSQSHGQAALAACRAAELPPAADTMNNITCLQLLWKQCRASYMSKYLQ